MHDRYFFLALTVVLGAHALIIFAIFSAVSYVQDDGDFYRTAARLAPIGHMKTEVGNMYRTGDGVVRNYREAIEWYEDAGSHGEAQYNLALMYENGQGVSQNSDVAAELYRKAARNGSARAQYVRGVWYFEHRDSYTNSNGVMESYIWLSLAASQGHVEARNLLDVIEQNLTPKEIAWVQAEATERADEIY